MMLRVRVRPGAHRTSVGGRHRTDDGRPDALAVSVTERALEGRANAAVEAALAEALGIRRREVRLVSGRTARTKVVEVPDECASRVAELLALNP